MIKKLIQSGKLCYTKKILVEKLKRMKMMFKKIKKKKRKKTLLKNSLRSAEMNLKFILRNSTIIQKNKKKERNKELN